MSIQLDWLYRGKRIRNAQRTAALTNNKTRCSKPAQDVSPPTIPKLKRLKFALDKLPGEPAQELPSITPRMGEVWIPRDMVSGVPNLSQGITPVEGQTLVVSKYTKDSPEYLFALEEEHRFLKESKRQHHLAHRAAEALAEEVSQYTSIAEDSNCGSSLKAGKISIEKPLLRTHRPGKTNSTYILQSRVSSDQLSCATSDSDAEKTLTLDKLYTRCCHVREIMPVVTTLKQLQGKQTVRGLRFMNPEPTLVDLVTFCDFIAITSIPNIYFDNVNLSAFMLRILLASLVHSKSLDRLTLRNVPISVESWYLLCDFLRQNESITRVDISQTKSKLAPGEDTHRDQLDWNIFIDVLKTRKGKPLQELLLNGIRINLIQSCDDLFNAIGKQAPATGVRLGLATTQLKKSSFESLMRFISSYPVQGVDTAYMDMSQHVNMLVMTFKQLRKLNSPMTYWVMKSCEIEDIDDMKEIVEALSRLSNLSYLDISNNPQIFPHLFAILHLFMPSFTNLTHIVLDDNAISIQDMSVMTTILIDCKKLQYISFRSAAKDVSKVKSFGAFLYFLIKELPCLQRLKYDIPEIPANLQLRITTILNKRLANSQDVVNKFDEFLFVGELLIKAIGDFSITADNTQKYLTKVFYNKAKNLSKEVKDTLRKWLATRSSTNTNFSLEEKENTISCIILQDNLVKLIEALETYFGRSFLQDPKPEKYFEQMLTNRPCEHRSSKEQPSYETENKCSGSMPHKNPFIDIDKALAQRSKCCDRSLLDIMNENRVRLYVPVGKELREIIMQANNLKTMDDLISTIGKVTTVKQHIPKQLAGLIAQMSLMDDDVTKRYDTLIDSISIGKQ